jgi:hypothetical protein
MAKISLMKAIGTTNGDFLEGLILQLVNASKEKTPSDKWANFMLAVVKGIEPRDQIEACSLRKWRRYIWFR